MSPPLFTRLYDQTAQNRSYLSLAAPNLAHAKPPDRASFLSDALPVSPRVSTRFSSDLTPDDDDILIAVLSLLLLFAIDALVSAVLLRTRGHAAAVHPFSFAVRHVADLAVDLRLSSLLPTLRARRRPRRGNARLLAVAAAVVLLSLAAQVAVLFLTNPATAHVSNAHATLRLEGPFLPAWNPVWAHFTASVARPCTSPSLSGVDQRATTVSACLSSNLSLATDARFIAPQAAPVSLVFTSDMHEFGAEHNVSLGAASATFSTRAYFRLSDARERVMPRAAMRLDRLRRVREVHRQYVAFLFSAYIRETSDVDAPAPSSAASSSPRLDTLNTLRFRFSETEGPLVDILIVNGHRIVVRRTSVRYTTSVTGALPGGPAALLVALAVLKSAAAIAVAGPNTRDLIMGSGSVRETEARVWTEQYRPVNWLTLLIVVCVVVAALLVLRVFLKPSAMAEIAGEYVAEQVGAAQDRDPLFMDASEQQTFQVPKRAADGRWLDPGFPEPTPGDGEVVLRGDIGAVGEW